MKHSPAPWKDDSMEFSAGWRCIVTLPGGRKIDIADPRDRKTDARDAANAKLVATTPELALLVERMHYILDGGGKPSLRERDAWMEDAEKVLRKAGIEVED